jgi:hypothetical protein
MLLTRKDGASSHPRGPALHGSLSGRHWTNAGGFLDYFLLFLNRSGDAEGCIVDEERIHPSVSTEKSLVPEVQNRDKSKRFAGRVVVFLCLVLITKALLFIRPDLGIVFLDFPRVGCRSRPYTNAAMHMQAL